MIQSRWTRNGIVLRDVQLRKLRRGWVRLSVSAAGICGSDLNRMRSQLGVGETPGHEVVGTILQSTASMPDATYAVDPWLVCGSCEYCVAGRSEQCSKGQPIGLSVAGGLAQTIDVPVSNLHLVSPQLSSLQASLVEPFAVCIRAIHLCELKLDSHLLIIGAGSLGLISGLLARSRARRASITVLHDYQRSLAEKLGLEPVEVDDLDDWMKENSPDVVLEAVGGATNTLQRAVEACRPTGRVVVMGMFMQPIEVTGELLVSKGLTIIGSRLYGQTGRGTEVRAATEILPRFRGELHLLQSHQFPLSEIEVAIATAADPEQHPIKVTVLP